MNKFELVSAVAEKVGISKKDSGIIIDEVVNVITETPRAIHLLWL